MATRTSERQKQGEAPTRRKIALIIANEDYDHPQNQLKGVINNAKQLAQSLQKIQFRVQMAFNLDRKSLTDTFLDFARTIQDGDLVLFFYSGHGTQSNQDNYLITIKDTKMVDHMDFEDFAFNFTQNINRFTDKNPSFATVFILDCPRTYTRIASRKSSTSNPVGFIEMKPIQGSFIQFACAANETEDRNSRPATSNLFIKHLMLKISSENIHVPDLFQQISDAVRRESNGKQVPLSINGLNRLAKVYLNEVIVIAAPVEIEEEVTRSTEEIIKEHRSLRAYHQNFVDIAEVVDESKPDIIKSKQLTKTILSMKPTGELNDEITACHILYQLVDGDRCNCLFFDSNQGTQLHDASTSLADLSLTNRPFVLHLTSADGLGGKTYPSEKQNDPKFYQRLNDRIGHGTTHPILEDLQNRIASAHSVNKNVVKLTKVYQGSFRVAYEIEQEESETLKTLHLVPSKLGKYIPTFVGGKLHPLYHRPTFDKAMFDSRGNKQFGPQAETHKVGPRGREKTYTTPIGWTRHGLKVLGRYESDEWLHPFRDPGNWYRAYHGTGRATTADFGSSQLTIEKRYAPIDAIGSIHKNGFRPARVTAYGAGVYASPDPRFPDEQGYVSPVEIQIGNKIESFRCMLQVAINPDGFTEGRKDIWVVPEPANIRPYGILIKRQGQKNANAYKDD